MQSFPWDNIIPSVDERTPVGGRECSIVMPTVEDTNNFLNQYHFQKTCKGQIIRYGLLYEGMLVAVITFGLSRYRKDCQYELLRLCFHPGYSVKGGSEKMFNKFLKDYAPHSVVSYCDKAKFTGKVYVRLGFKKVSNGRPKEHFWRHIDKKHITSVELAKYGADALIGTKLGKGTDNRKILLDNGFEVIKDYGQDVYVYLGESEYFGYIYCTTDMTNGKKYIGQHVSNKFDPTYYGSGQIIKRILNKRPDTLKLELLEWCKQDISEREVYYIQHFNTLFPNGYNLTERPQNFLYQDSQAISERQKAFAQTEAGKEFYKTVAEKNREFYKTEAGQEQKKIQAEKYKEFVKTDIGQEMIQKKVEKYKNWVESEEGQKTIQMRNQKLIDINQTEYGITKEQKRLQSLRDFYQSEEGKKQKQIQIEKYKEFVKTDAGQEMIQKKAEKYKIWAESEEGKKKLKQAQLKRMIKQANSMSDEEWIAFVGAHPKTQLKKYRGMVYSDQL